MCGVVLVIFCMHYINSCHMPILISCIIALCHSDMQNLLFMDLPFAVSHLGLNTNHNDEKMQSIPRANLVV